MGQRKYESDYLNRLHVLLDKTKRKSYVLLDPQKDDIIGEIGCGVGNDAFALAECGAAVYGVDHDEALITVAEGLRTNSLNPKFFTGEADHLPFEDCSITKIRFDRVMQHIDEHAKVFQEIKRVLKPNGIVQIVDTDYLSFTLFLEDYKFERHIIERIAYNRIPNGYKVRTLPSALKRNGFEIIHQEIHNYIVSDFGFANQIIWFDTVINEELLAGRISEDNYDLWQLQKSKPNGQFNFSFNLIILQAVFIK